MERRRLLDKLMFS